MRWALIDGTVVANIVEQDTDPAEVVAPLTTVDVTDLHVNPGDTYDGRTFAPRAESDTEAHTRRASEIRTLTAEALSHLQAIIDTPPVTFSTVAQAQTQVRALQSAVKLQARVLRRLVRLAADQLDGTD